MYICGLVFNSSIDIWHGHKFPIIAQTHTFALLKNCPPVRKSFVYNEVKSMVPWTLLYPDSTVYTPVRSFKQVQDR